jgi:CRISPR-associated endoribonuclease Cas6
VAAIGMYSYLQHNKKTIFKNKKYMRIHLKLTPNTETVPFNYQGHLVQRFHEWLGENDVHDDLSLYSLSWLWGENSKAKNGFNFRQGAEWFISAYDDEIIKKLIDSIMKNPELAFGMSVQELTMQMTPKFQEKAHFRVASPVFIKRNIDTEQKFYYHSDKEANQLLTETLQSKLKKANLNTDVQVRFDDTYQNPQISGTVYKGFRKKGSVCPVIVEGSAEAVGFAWNVGIGNGCGIGFGALV